MKVSLPRTGLPENDAVESILSGILCDCYRDEKEKVQFMIEECQQGYEELRKSIGNMFSLLEKAGLTDGKPLPELVDIGHPAFRPIIISQLCLLGCKDYLEGLIERNAIDWIECEPEPPTEYEQRLNAAGLK